MEDILQRNLQLQRQKKHNRMLTKKLQAEFEQFVLKQVENYGIVRSLKYDVPLVLIVTDSTTLADMEHTHEIEQQPAVGRFMNGCYFQLIVGDDYASITVTLDSQVYDENNNSLSHASYYFEEEAEKPLEDLDDPQLAFSDWLQRFYQRTSNPLLLLAPRFKEGQKALEVRFNDWDKLQQEWLKNSTKEINNHAK